jgi:hypothetical protein
MSNKKSKDDILASLTSNLPTTLSENTETPVLVGPSNDDIIKDTEDDYEFARAHIKKLILASDDAIDRLHELATDAEHPRAFEVLTTMIKNTADMNSSLLDLVKNRKKIVQEPVGGGPSTIAGNVTTNNSIYVGTTADLQRFLKSREEPIDI